MCTSGSQCTEDFGQDYGGLEKQIKKKSAVAGELGRVIVLGYLLPDHGNFCDAFRGLVQVITLTNFVARVTGRKTCSKDP